MDAQLQSALRKIDTLILDIDHVLHHYGDVYAREFSVATARSFIELHPDLAARFDLDELTEMAVNSYKRTGKTTTWFAEKFGIDEMGLYVHHHDALCEEGGFIHTQFIQGKIEIDPELAPLFESVRKTGIKIVAVTNGTQGYGETVLGAKPNIFGHGIARLFDAILGMDSFGDKNVTGKAYGAFIHKVLDKLDVLKAFNSSVKSAVELKHDNVSILDDSSPNLRAPFKFFGMHTTLKLTDHNSDQTEYACHSVADVKNFLKQIVEAKSQPLEYPRLVATGL